VVDTVVADDDQLQSELDALLLEESEESAADPPIDLPDVLSANRSQQAEQRRLPVAE
jgi:hypothetical protein